MREYLTRVSVDVVITADGAQEAHDKLNRWFGGQQLLEKLTDSEVHLDNLDWTDWTIKEEEK